MRKFVAILLTLALTALTVRAQYASVNVDYKTMAAMSEAFMTEASMEALHNENLQKIYDSYTAAEVASAGIFSSKYLDRKALTNLNLWNSADENYYYKRIYNIVSKRIIPRTLTCARLMMEDPSTAIYWGKLLVEDHGRCEVPLSAIRECCYKLFPQFQGFALLGDFRAVETNL